MDLATLGIRVDATGAIAQTKALTGNLETLGGTASKLTSVMGGLALAIGAGFIAHAFIDNTVEAQHALAQLEAAIASTGGTANKSVADLDAFSMALQQTSTFSDEAVKGAQAMLLTFNKIEGVNFDAATSAVANLAARMGTDLQGAAVQVGKALQDPATGLTALRRSGVSFTEAQIEVIKKLQDTGHEAEAQRMILAELEKEFGGAASAARNTLGGSLTVLKNNFGDLFEQTEESTSGIVSFINALSHGLQVLNENRDVLKSVAIALGIVAAGAAAVGVAFVAAGAAGTAFYMVMASVVASIAAVAAPVTIAVALFAGLVLAVQQVRDEMKGLDDDQEEQSRNTKEYVKYLKDLGVAHAHYAKQKADEQAASKKAAADAAKALDEEKKHAKDLSDAEQAAHDKRVALQKDIASIRTQAIVAADAAQAKRLEGVRGLQDEEEAQTRLVAALKLGTDAYAAQKDADEISNAVRSAGIKLGDAEYDEAVRAAKAIQDRRKETEKLTKANEDAAKAQKDLNDMVAEGVATLNRVAKEGMAEQAKEQQKYVDDMRDIWREGAGDIASGFVESMAKGFEETYELAVKLIKRMEEAGKNSGFAFGALKGGAAALGGGMAGYAVGQATGNKVTGALGGAASGALAGSAFGPVGTAIGAVAGFVGGIIGAGNAAKEAAKQMAALQESLAQNIAAIKATIAGDELGQSIAKVRADFSALRKQTEDAYSGGGAGSDQVRKRNAVLAELNSLEVTRILQLEAEANLRKKQLNEDIQVQILRNNGLAEEADAMARAIDQERRFTELRKQGIDEATIAQLAQSEAKRDADAAAQMAADALKEAADAAAEAAANAAAQAKAQAQAVEDINVELMGAKGDTQGAADLKFELDQQRRLEQAQGEQSDEYVAKLLELQQIQRDQRAADQLIAATGGDDLVHSVGDGSQSAATSATSAVQATVTERTAYALVDIGRQQLSAQLQMVDLLSSLASRGGGSSSFQDVNAYLGAGALTSGRYAGNVTR